MEVTMHDTSQARRVIWTDAQWQSIYAKGQDVLVAAAAGSGKRQF